MKFEPKTEREILEAMLAEPGVYDFSVLEAVDHVSSQGNLSIKLKVQVYVGEGVRHLYDYLSGGSNFGARKLRHFCSAVGILDRYEAGEISPTDCIGRHGRCEVRIKKDKTGEYPDRNEIADYIESQSVIKPAPVKFENDELPF